MYSNEKHRIITDSTAELLQPQLNILSLAAKCSRLQPTDCSAFSHKTQRGYGKKKKLKTAGVK